MVILVACSAAAGAYLYTRLQAAVFRSSVRLEVSARFDNGQQLALERLLPQLAARVRTTDVAREVDGRLQLDLGTDAILARLRAESFAQNGQILIEADDVDPARVEAIVSATARVFEEQHAARNQGIPYQDRALVTILDRPTPARLVWPQTRTLVSVAVLLGAMAGVLLALGLEYADDTLKSAEDVERTLALHTLGWLPAGAALLHTSAAEPASAAREARG